MFWFLSHSTVSNYLLSDNFDKMSNCVYYHTMCDDDEDDHHRHRHRHHRRRHINLPKVHLNQLILFLKSKVFRPFWSMPVES